MRHKAARWMCASVCAAGILVVAAIPVLASPGDLDVTFGGDGKVEMDVFRFPQGTGLAVQPDDKLVVAVGSSASDLFAVMRFLPDGTPDASFGHQGRVRTAMAGISSATDLVLQPDGKILVAGSSGNRMGVVRYLTDGSLDRTFAGDGKAFVSISDRSVVGAALALTPRGSIIVAGSVSRTEGKPMFAIVRLTQDGSIDPTFSGDGRFVRPLAKRCICSFATDVEVAGDGSIVAVGSAAQRAAILILRRNGILDPSFAQDGMRLTRLGSEGEVRASGVALTTSGDVMVTGWSSSSLALLGFVARLTRDGPIDPAFSGDGIARLSEIAFPGSLAIQPNGRVAVAGAACCGGGSELTFALGRLTATGRRDLTFGADGFVTLEPFELALFPGWAAAALQPDGRIVVTGGLEFDGLLLARYLA
jgi:uncharacterized delta-60 repeat protein